MKVELEFWAKSPDLIEKIKRLKFIRDCCEKKLELVSICGYGIRPEDLNESEYLEITVTDWLNRHFTIRGASGLSPHDISNWAGPHNIGHVIVLAGENVSPRKLKGWHRYRLSVKEKSYGCE